MEAAEKISVGVIKEKTKSKAVKKEAEGMRVSTREKVCYGVGDIGANLVWTTVASFLTIYCTDVAGIAAGVVGTPAFLTLSPHHIPQMLSLYQLSPQEPVPP